LRDPDWRFLHDESYSLSGGVGLPPGASQRLFAAAGMPTSFSSSVPVDPVVEGKATRADQKLVSEIDMESGRSRIKRPTSAWEQNPPRIASDVHTYVLC
jgi:hypothetical protein